MLRRKWWPQPFFSWAVELYLQSQYEIPIISTSCLGTHHWWKVSSSYNTFHIIILPYLLLKCIIKLAQTLSNVLDVQLAQWFTLQLFTNEVWVQTPWHWHLRWCMVTRPAISPGNSEFLSTDYKDKLMGRPGNVYSKSELHLLLITEVSPWMFIIRSALYSTWWQKLGQPVVSVYNCLSFPVSSVLKTLVKG